MDHPGVFYLASPCSQEPGVLRLLWDFPCALQRRHIQAGGSGSAVCSGVLRFVVCLCGEEGKADIVVYLPGQKSTMWLDM